MADIDIQGGAVTTDLRSVSYITANICCKSRNLPDVDVRNYSIVAAVISEAPSAAVTKTHLLGEIWVYLSKMENILITNVKFPLISVLKLFLFYM